MCQVYNSPKPNHMLDSCVCVCNSPRPNYVLDSCMCEYVDKNECISACVCVCVGGGGGGKQLQHTMAHRQHN